MGDDHAYAVYVRSSGLPVSATYDLGAVPARDTVALVAAADAMAYPVTIAYQLASGGVASTMLERVNGDLSWSV